MTPASLVAEIDRDRGDANLSSAIRLFVLDHLHHADNRPTTAVLLDPDRDSCVAGS